MNKTITSHRNLINFGIPLSLFAVLILVMKSSFLTGNDTVNLAITADLLFTVPLVYFLLIRKTEIPKTTVVPVMVIGLLIGLYLLPKDSQTYLLLFKTWVLPAIEVSILAFVILKVRGAVKAYKGSKSAVSDFYSALKNTCQEILPVKVALPFAMEVAVIYYGFINWRTPTLQENQFTYHKRSGTPALLGIFIFIIGIETVAFHLLLASWSVVAAWVLTTLSIYTGIQVLGFAKSLSKRPIAIHQDSLMLKYGILSETEIPFSAIEHIELSRKVLDENSLSEKLSPLGGMESHNVIIHLNRACELAGFYGMTKHFKVLGLHVDKPKDFKEALENAFIQVD